MNRKEFLISIWKNGLKPILFVATIYFCLKFLYNTFAENGTERFLTILIFDLGLLLITLELIGFAFSSIIKKIYSTLSDSLKLWLRIARKTFNYIAPIVLGAIVYNLWEKDWFIAAFFIGFLLIQRIAEIINEERQTSTVG